MLDVISAFYEAAADDSLWDQAVSKYAHLVGRNQGCLQFVDYKQNEFEYLGVTGWNVDDFLSHPHADEWPSHDPWAHLLETKETHYIGSSRLPQSEYYDSLFYNELTKPIGWELHDLLAAVFYDRDNLTGILVLYSDHQDRPFSAEEEKTLRPLYSHIKNALSLHSKFDEVRMVRHAQESLLHQSPNAVFVLNPNGKIVFLNRKAEAMCAEADVLAIRDGKLSAKHNDSNARLQRAIHNLKQMNLGNLQAEIDQMLLFDEGEHSIYSLRLMPVQKSGDRYSKLAGMHASGIIVHVSDHRFLGEKQVLLFQDHYGLTQAEGKLLLKLGNGKTLNSIADSTGVSVHTLRTQIKSIFEKTDTHSQNQLIQLLLTGIG